MPSSSSAKSASLASAALSSASSASSVASMEGPTASATQQLFLKIPDEENPNVASPLHWNRREKYAWFVTLLAGTTALYASRTTVPLVAPSASASLRWSKTETGTVLSSFFWGYALTQVLGGYLGDRFGAERVLLAAGVGWGLITFWFHRIVYLFKDRDSSLNVIVLSRVLWGAFQGLHFPAMASLSSRHLNARDRSFFFSSATAGSSVGTLLTGTLGSYLQSALGWPAVFYGVGAVGLGWAAAMRCYAMEMHRRRRQVVGMHPEAVGLLTTGVGAPGAGVRAGQEVPWLAYLGHSSLWAAVTAHFCHNNCFFMLLSWLPTYFHDNFPGAQGWVFNVVPWLLMIPGLACASVMTKKLLSRGCEVGRARKVAEVVCMCTEAACLLIIGHVTYFPLALALMSTAMFASGFHALGSVVNPQDLAPRHSGSIFGVMNAAGAVPGFVGVYVAGYILDLTDSWASVFNVTAAVNLFGAAVFVAFGSGKPIVN